MKNPYRHRRARATVNPTLVDDLIVDGNSTVTDTDGYRRYAAIPATTRNASLFSIACALRGRGLEYEGIRAELTGINATLCQPPLPASELRSIARSASKYPIGTGRGSERSAAKSTAAFDWAVELRGLLAGSDLAHGARRTLTALFTIAASEGDFDCDRQLVVLLDHRRLAEISGQARRTVWSHIHGSIFALWVEIERPGRSALLRPGQKHGVATLFRLRAPHLVRRELVRRGHLRQGADVSPFAPDSAFALSSDDPGRSGETSAPSDDRVIAECVRDDLQPSHDAWRWSTGLGESSRLILVTLTTAPAANQIELADRSHLSLRTVKARLPRLVALKLVENPPHGGWRRGPADIDDITPTLAS